MTATTQVGAERKTRGLPMSPREVAIKAVVEETSCTRDEAREMIEWLHSIVCDSRRKDYRLHFPRERTLNSSKYVLFEQVIPHSSAAKSNSAHAAIEAYVLDPSKDEFGLRHEMRERGGRFYCTVSVCINVMR